MYKEMRMADDPNNGKSSNSFTRGSSTKSSSVPKNTEPNQVAEVYPFLQELYKADNKISITKNANQKPGGNDDVVNTAKSVSLKTAPQDISTKKPRKPSSVRRNKPTVLTFQSSSKRNGTAHCMLVLCNISDVPLHFTLKGCKDSNVSATFGDGHIGPHAQLRTLLTVDRPRTCNDWADAAQPRILLATRFLDVKNEQEVTYTRLLGRISPTKMCTVTNPPVEQFLLDALGNLAQHSTSYVFVSLCLNASLDLLKILRKVIRDMHSPTLRTSFRIDLFCFFLSYWLSL